MTVEKPVVAGWQRAPGWTTDVEARSFAQALARKRVRFAFPEVGLVAKLQKRLIEKHDRDTVEGRALRALREIRISAAPSWNFVRRGDEVEFEDKSWSTHLESWLKLVPASTRFRKIDGQITTLEDLSAADYVSSDLLDLDHLSSRAEQ